MEKLAETSKRVAMVKKIQTQVGFKFDDESTKFIESTGQWDDKKKQFYVNLPDEFGKQTKTFVNDLTQERLKLAMQSQESLTKMAEKSQSLDERWENLKERFKSALFPLFDGIEIALRGPLESLTKVLSDKKVIENISKFAESIGSFISGIGKFIVEFPKLSVGLGLGLVGTFKALQWSGYGAILGASFLKTVNALGGIKPQTTTNPISGNTNKPTLGSKVGMTAASTAIAGLLTGYNTYQQNKENGMSSEENLKRSAIRGTGSAIGAGVGTALGLATGPLAPIAVPLLAMGGSYAGELLGGVAENSIMGPSVNDAVISKGIVTPINTQDNIVAMKPQGPIDNMLSSNKSNTPSEISFKPINIVFSPLEIKLNGSTLSIEDFNKNPELTRELTLIIQQELKKAITGGKLTTA